MAELAVPMVGLGLLYIANKQNNESKKDDVPNQVAKQENFRTLGNTNRLQGYENKDNANYEMDVGNTRQYDESNKLVTNFPVESNQHTMETVKSYPNPNCATDKYFLQNNMQQSPGVSKVSQLQNFTCQSLSGNEINSKDFKHNNMVPFFGSKIRGKTFSYDNEIRLDNMQGAGSQHIKKTEQAPLFKPQESMQHAHGAPNNSDFYQSRVNPSLKVANVKPWEEVKVAPGLGKGFGTEGSGGFNSGMECRDQWEPKTVDQLRTANNPKLSFKGVTLGGKRPVQNMGKMGKFEKNRPDTFYINTPERYFTTTGAEKGQTAQATQVFKPVNRISTTREHFGNGSKAGSSGATYATGKYEDSRKITYDGPPVMNPYANNQGVANEKDYGKDSYNILPNSRSLSGNKTEFGGVNGTVKALIAPILDVLRPTRKDNVVGNIRETGNVQPVIPAGTSNTMNPADRPKTTIKEMTVDSIQHWFVEGQNSGGYTNAKHTPIQNQRDSTNYVSMGNVGNTPGMSSETSYDAAYNARVPDGREQVSVNRPNQGGMQIFNQQMNVNMSKSENDRLNNRMFVPQSLGATNTSKEMYGEMRKANSYKEINESRNDAALLKAFKENPYTQSLNSVA